MNADWEHASDFIHAMLELKRDGELQAIYNEWIGRTGTCGEGGSAADEEEKDYTS